jgi:hypothetical protein
MLYSLAKYNGLAAVAQAILVPGAALFGWVAAPSLQQSVVSPGRATRCQDVCSMPACSIVRDARTGNGIEWCRIW